MKQVKALHCPLTVLKVKRKFKGKPKPIIETFPQFYGIVKYEEISVRKNSDRMWSLCQLMGDDITEKLPTWAAYNSLINDNQEHTLCQGLPLSPLSPTDWSSLYTSLKLVQEIL